MGNVPPIVRTVTFYGAPDAMKTGALELDVNGVGTGDTGGTVPVDATADTRCWRWTSPVPEEALAYSSTAAGSSDPKRLGALRDDGWCVR